ncbi:PPE family protein [Mycobacterium tuberculosis]|nr:PPE family protein [Mycobacterium tuberculosis]
MVQNGENLFQFRREGPQVQLSFQDRTYLVTGGGSGIGKGVAANLGRAASVGSLSVPQAWAAANQAVTPAARALPLTSLTSAAQTAPGHMLGGLPLGQLTNSGGGVSNALRMPPRAYVMPRVPAAG